MHFLGSLAVFAVLAGLSLVGPVGCRCGGNATDAGPPDAAGDAAMGDPTRIYFRPELTAAADNPFPGDFLTVADPTMPTGRRLDIPAARSFPYADLLNTLDGFTVTYGAYVRTTRALDPGSIAASSFEVYPYDPVGTGAVSRVAGTVSYIAAETGVSFQPERPLASRSRFLVVARAGWLDYQGNAVAGSEGWAEAIAAGDPEAMEILAFLEDRAGIDPAEVLHAHVYTTQTVQEDLLVVAARIANGPAPVTVITDAFTPRDGTGALDPGLLARLPPLPGDLPLDLLETDDVAVIAFGTIETVEYRNAADAVWERDPVTFEPVDQGPLVLEFIVTLPVGATGPVPMVLFSHALGVCKETVIALADALGEWGMGAVGLDVVGHGSRSTSGACDSFSVADFLDVVDPRVSRDAFRQTVSDQMHLVRLLADAASGGVDLLPWSGVIATSGDGVPDFDSTRPTAIVGQSLGSFVGTITAAVEPRIAGAVLDVGGLSILAVIGSATGALSSEAAFAGLMLLEPGDNWAYARGMVEPWTWPGLTDAPTSVLLQMAVMDDTVSNASTYALAALIGAPLVTPAPVGDMGLGTAASPVAPLMGPTVGMFAFDMVEHEFFLLPGMDPAPTFAAQEQAVAFLYTSIVAGFPAPVIVDPFDPAQVAAIHP